MAFMGDSPRPSRSQGHVLAHLISYPGLQLIVYPCDSSDTGTLNPLWQCRAMLNFLLTVTGRLCNRGNLYSMALTKKLRHCCTSTSIFIYKSGLYRQQFAYKHVLCTCECTGYLYNFLAPPISSAIWVTLLCHCLCS